MLNELDERLQLLEETIGINEDKSLNLDIAELRNTLAKKGFNHALKVDIEKLKKLKDFVDKPDSRPLSEKISFVQCCAEITKKRAELLQEFESRLKVVLNTDDLQCVSEYEKQLEPMANDIDGSLQIYKRNTVEIENFKKDYAEIMASLQECIQQLAEKVNQAETKQKKLGAHSSDA